MLISRISEFRFHHDPYCGGWYPAPICDISGDQDKDGWKAILQIQRIQADWHLSVVSTYALSSCYWSINTVVSNIFFSALIGFVIYSVPTTDYYTRHYLTATTVLWATTFSMIVLFFPKLLLFFKKGQQYDGSANAAGGRRPDVSGRLRPMADRLSNPRQIGGGGGGPPGAEETFTKNRELISINRMLASPNPLGSTFMPARKNSVVPHHLSNNDSVLEAHEVWTYRPHTHIMACSSYILRAVCQCKLYFAIFHYSVLGIWNMCFFFHEWGTFHFTR